MWHACSVELIKLDGITSSFYAIVLLDAVSEGCCVCSRGIAIAC